MLTASTRLVRITLGAALFAPMLLGLPGCSDEGSYKSQRPPMDQIDPRDRGLQSKDVLVATDQLAADLLALPELNASRSQWTVVVKPVEDYTIDRRGMIDYRIFIERLKTNLSRQGRGRITIIDNRERVGNLRDQELDKERDDFGQGGTDPRSAPRAIQPDYVLYGKAMDMPNRGTNYYQIQFDLTNLNTRETVWTNAYEVRVSRK